MRDEIPGHFEKEEIQEFDSCVASAGYMEQKTVN